MASRTISVYLLKKEVASYVDALKDKDNCDPIKSPKGNRNNAVLFVKSTPSKPPRWQALLDDAFDLASANLRVQSASAVLFLTVKNRKFVLAFGYGHAMIDEEKFVHDFGLKASLNAVEPEQLRHVDAMRPESRVLRKRHQVGRASSIMEFEIDQLLDIVRSITGSSADQTFAKKVTGTAAFKITADLEYASLSSKCVQALELYESDKYKDHFPLIDNLRPETDPVTITQLNDKLLATLNDRDFDHISLSPPEIVEPKEIVGFKYRAKKNDELKPDLDIEDYFALHSNGNALDLEILKRHRVYVQLEDDSVAHQKWTIYRCIIFDCMINDRQYVLAEGHWYCIEEEFHKKVRDFFKKCIIEKSFPDAKADEYEKDYCIRAARRKGVFLFDRKTFSIPDENVKYELCDLLTEDQELTHIKPYRNGSAALSHLFRQGAMAGWLFFRQSGFRKEAHDYLKSMEPNAAHLIPRERINPQEYTLLFGIIAKRKVRTQEFDIPFFSKVSFRHAADELSAYGYKIKVCFIERKT